MQCAGAILPSVACRAALYISTLPHKQNDFRGKSYLLLDMCFDLLYNFVFFFSVKFLFLRRIQRDVITNVFIIYLQHAPLHPVMLHACRKLYVMYTVFTFLWICLLFMH